MDLTETDATWMLPLMLGTITLCNFEVCFLCHSPLFLPLLSFISTFVSLLFKPAYCIFKYVTALKTLRLYQKKVRILCESFGFSFHSFILVFDILVSSTKCSQWYQLVCMSFISNGKFSFCFEKSYESSKPEKFGSSLSSK